MTSSPSTPLGSAAVITVMKWYASTGRADRPCHRDDRRPSVDNPGQWRQIPYRTPAPPARRGMPSYFKVPQSRRPHAYERQPVSDNGPRRRHTPSPIVRHLEYQSAARETPPAASAYSASSSAWRAPAAQTCNGWCAGADPDGSDVAPQQSAVPWRLPHAKCADSGTAIGARRSAGAEVQGRSAGRHHRHRHTVGRADFAESDQQVGTIIAKPPKPPRWPSVNSRNTAPHVAPIWLQLAPRSPRPLSISTAESESSMVRTQTGNARRAWCYRVKTMAASNGRTAGQRLPSTESHRSNGE